MSTPLAQEAEVMRISRLCGMIENPAIVSWCDEKIGEGFVEDELMDISTNPLSTAEYLSKLRSLAKGSDSFAAVRVICSQVHERLKQDAAQAGTFAGSLYQVVVENDGKMPQDLAFLKTASEEVSAGETGVKKFLDNLAQAAGK